MYHADSPESNQNEGALVVRVDELPNKCPVYVWRSFRCSCMTERRLPIGCFACA